jgi:hypothetical protein
MRSLYRKSDKEAWIRYLADPLDAGMTSCIREMLFLSPAPLAKQRTENHITYPHKSPRRKTGAQRPTLLPQAVGGGAQRPEPLALLSLSRHNGPATHPAQTQTNQLSFQRPASTFRLPPSGFHLPASTSRLENLSSFPRTVPKCCP